MVNELLEIIHELLEVVPDRQQVVEYVFDMLFRPVLINLQVHNLDDYQQNVENVDAD